MFVSHLSTNLALCAVSTPTEESSTPNGCESLKHYESSNAPLRNLATQITLAVRPTRMIHVAIRHCSFATQPSHARDSKSAIKAMKAMHGSARRGSQDTLSNNGITYRLLVRDPAITRTRQQVSNQSDESNARQRTAW